MGARPLRKVVNAALLPFVLLAAFDARGAQDNAVGGTVRSLADDKPLAGVTVALAQNDQVKDTTSDRDGVYVLRVPRSIATLHLVFKHPAYMRKTLRNIKNTEPQHKVKIVKLTPYDSASLNRLGEEAVQQLIAEARAEIGQTTAGWDAALWETGTTTLRLLVNAAGALDEQARQESETGNYAAAEALLRRALRVKSEILNRGDPAVEETVQAYAELLDKLGRKDEASELRRRSSGHAFFVPRGNRQSAAFNARIYPEDFASGERFGAWDSMPDDKRLSLDSDIVTVPVFLRGLDVEDFWLAPNARGGVTVEVMPITSEFSVRVVDEAGKVVAAGEQGEASWRAQAGAVYRVYVINRGSLTLARPVRISRERESAPATKTSPP